MNKAYMFTASLLLAIILVSCGANTSPVTYESVSQPSINPGDAVPAPTGEVILTVDGNISQKNVGSELQFDLATLESLGLVKYDVDDPFVKKNIDYTGVLISQILEVAGAPKDTESIMLTALDDYSVDMKVADALKWPFMVAIKADGEYMPIDKNGPLLSVIPYNDFLELDHLTYDSVWVWSLYKITVK
ncbi:MAG: molybdopterin-dependent oxidoreductase [Chloroflexi bacterium]|nr:molybdopterin-dependent oxidoreductase [Chloroflexota bacterium]